MHCFRQSSQQPENDSRFTVAENEAWRGDLAWLMPTGAQLQGQGSTLGVSSLLCPQDPPGPGHVVSRAHSGRISEAWEMTAPGNPDLRRCTAAKGHGVKDIWKLFPLGPSGRQVTIV